MSRRCTQMHADEAEEKGISNHGGHGEHGERNGERMGTRMSRMQERITRMKS